jgi:hypothetical protein
MRAVQIEKSAIHAGLYLAIEGQPNNHGVREFHFGEVASMSVGMGLIQLRDGYSIRSQFGEPVSQPVVWDFLNVAYIALMVYELSPGGSPL